MTIFKARKNPPLLAGAERRAVMTKLTAKKIEALRKAGHWGRVLDGDGLMLQCRGKGKDGEGRASWLLRYTVKGRVRELGLGSWKNVKLAEARAAAAQARAAVFKGDDPIAAKHPAKAKPVAAHTFGSAAEAFWEANQPRWRNSKVRQQWLPFLSRHCKAIWDAPIDQIDKHAVLAVISPLWTSKNFSAKRCLYRIGQVIKYAKFMGWRSGDNPAEYRGNISHACPRPANLNIRQGKDYCPTRGGGAVQRRSRIGASPPVNASARLGAHRRTAFSMWAIISSNSRSIRSNRASIRSRTASSSWTLAFMRSMFSLRRDSTAVEAMVLIRATLSSAGAALSLPPAPLPLSQL
jgi:hypothetical protein